MGLDAFETEGPRTYTEDKNKGPSLDDDVLHVPKGEEIPEDLKPDGVEVHEIIMREDTLTLKLPSGGPYYVCPECGEVAEVPSAIVKTDKLKFREEDWADEVFDWILDNVESLSQSEWEDRSDAELREYQIDDEEDDEDEEEVTTDTSSGSGLDSFMS